MTDAPLRIWMPTYGFRTFSEHDEGDVEYHLHTREALAQSPIVQAMIAEAVVRALDSVTTLHMVISDIRAATVGAKPMLSELPAALVAWRDDAVERERMDAADADLLRRADIMAGMLRMGERIAFGTDADMIAELAAAIRRRG